MSDQVFSPDYQHPEILLAQRKERMKLDLLRKSLPNLDLRSVPKEMLCELRKVLVEENIKKAREDLYTFVRLLAPLMLPEGYKDGKHIRIICEELMRLEQSIITSQESGGEIPPERLQLSLPPGGMKSLLASRFFPAWCLGRHPTWNVMQLGHSTDFARDNFGRKVKELIQSNEFRQIFPDTIIKSDVRAADRFETTMGGIYFCTGAGSAIAGRRAHLLISDDVLTEQTAYSDKERNSINNWYIPGARSRLLAYGGELMIATKWVLDDLLGYLERIDAKTSRPWRTIRIPAIIDEPSHKLLGLPIGTSFWPELWPTRLLLEKKESLTPGQWAALYMQNPIPEEGSWIKQEWIKWWDTEINGDIKVDFVVASIDSSFGSDSKQADPTAITVWGVFSTRETGTNGAKYDKHQIILLGARSGIWGFPELQSQMEEIKDLFNPDLFIVEKKVSGISLIQELKLRNYPIYEYRPDKDKKARVYSSTGTFHNGSVWFPKDRKWARDVLQELIVFPYGAHDDYVDTTTQVIIWMRQNYMLSQQNEVGYADDEEETTNVNFERRNYWSTVSEGA